MGRGALRKTVDGSVSYRCLCVSLDDALASACAAAIVPVEVVRASSVGDACARMSTVLPLIVVVEETMSADDRRTLAEYASACAAETVAIARDAKGAELTRLLLDALRTAELKRFRP
jgi:hypothetical protein